MKPIGGFPPIRKKVPVTAKNPETRAYSGSPLESVDMVDITSILEGYPIAE